MAYSPKAIVLPRKATPPRPPWVRFIILRCFIRFGCSIGQLSPEGTPLWEWQYRMALFLSPGRGWRRRWGTGRRRSWRWARWRRRRWWRLDGALGARLQLAGFLAWIEDATSGIVD